MITMHSLRALVRAWSRECAVEPTAGASLGRLCGPDVDDQSNAIYPQPGSIPAVSKAPWQGPPSTAAHARFLSHASPAPAFSFHLSTHHGIMSMSGGALFRPFRALGLIADDVPFAVQRRGAATFVTVSVGKAWQVRGVQAYACVRMQRVEPRPVLTRPARPPCRRFTTATSCVCYWSARRSART